VNFALLVDEVMEQVGASLVGTTHDRCVL
jgi:hypothetical protein